MPTLNELRRALRRIDGRGYKAYKEIAGRYAEGELALFVDHVQGDPFAAPSRLRARLPNPWPPELFASRVRQIALEDFLARAVARAIRRGGGGRRGSGKSGLVAIDAGGQEVLERTAVVACGDFVEARLEVGLPAAGRRVLGREAEALLCDALPRAVRTGLCEAPGEEARRFVECVENQEAIRAQLRERELVAFVGESAILPRESGVSDRPLRDAVPFRAPEELRIELEVPNPPGRVAGMGLPRGVTLIVGGGYHGKSTVLRALERGVYPHVPGDGREWVVTDPDAVKVRAEDGRRVERVDISSFIGELPGGRATTAFSTDDASGSTSQAAGIVEAIEAGASAILMDEDTCATNFMVRDARMQALVPTEDEPITPFVDRVRELHDALGLSTVLVMGGSGDYFDAADTVIAMRAYRPEVATARAQEIAGSHATGRRRESTTPLRRPAPRAPLAESVDPSRGRRDVKIDARAVDELGFGTQRIDLRCVGQLVDRSQTRAVGHALHIARERLMDGKTPLPEVLDALEARLEADGLDALSPFGRGRHPGNLARPRRHEIAAALNRLRTLRMRGDPGRGDPDGA
jgi:predicted ABC-class ATPase